MRGWRDKSRVFGVDDGTGCVFEVRWEGVNWS